MYFKVPSSTREWLQIARAFEERWNYPYALGAIDGKHNVNQKPANCVVLIISTTSTRIQLYYLQSLVQTMNVYMQTLAQMVDVMMVVYGTQCGLNAKIQERENELSIPQPSPISTVRNKKIPHVFLGDDAFALRKNMMKPFPQRNLTLEKRICNYRDSRTRRISDWYIGEPLACIQIGYTSSSAEICKKQVFQRH